MATESFKRRGARKRSTGCHSIGIRARVVGIIARLCVGRSRVRFLRREGKGIFLSSKMSRSAAGPTRLLFSGHHGLSLDVKAAKMTIHPDLVLRLRMGELYLYSPICVSVA